MTSQNKVTNASCDRDLILIWLGGKSETTQISYRSTVEKFIEFIAKPLSEVKLEDLQLWERGLKARFQLTTVANKVLVIKSLFSFAVKTGYLTLNVGSFLKTPKAKEKLADRILDVSQVQGLIKYGVKNERDRLMLLLILAIKLETLLKLDDCVITMPKLQVAKPFTCGRLKSGNLQLTICFQSLRC